MYLKFPLCVFFSEPQKWKIMKLYPNRKKNAENETSNRNTAFKYIQERNKKKCNYFTTTMTKYKMELMKKKTIKHFFFIFEYNVYLI